MSVISRAADLLFQRKTRREVETRQSAFEVYHRSLMDDVNGRDVDLDRLEEVLPALQKTIDDFANDVALMTQRLADSKFVDTEALTRKKNAQATAKSEQLQAELDALVVKLRTQIQAEIAVIEETNAQLVGIENARSRLINTCLDPDMLEQFAAANERRMKVGRTIYELQDPRATAEKEYLHAKEMLRLAEEAHGHYKDILAGAGSPKHNEKLTEAKAYHDSRKKRFDDFDAKLSAAKQEQTKIENDIKRIQAEMLKP